MNQLTSSPLLTLENVGIRYEQEEEPIVRDVSLTIDEGESLLVMGPSGCGKSTLAMLCARLIPQSVEAVVTGTVQYDDKLMQPGQIGYVFQDPDAQFCMLTVADEIAFGLENRGLDPDLMPDRIQYALQKAGLDVPFDALSAMFSGGMKQLLGIATALALDPALLIFDEPTANLDPLASSQIFTRIAALHQERKTMLVIEHKFQALLPYMDRVVVFDERGQIHRIGEPATVLVQEWDWLVDHGIVSPFMRNPFLPEPIVRLKQKTGASPKSKSGDTILTLRDVVVKYGEQTVLDRLSLSVQEGEWLAIVGPNGAGKSTLLQVMAGLEKPFAGDILLTGKVVATMKPKDRFTMLAYCFQNPEYQFIFERVCDELANRFVGDEVPEEVTTLLQRFGLEKAAKESPFSLSQGQKRRLSVASMLRKEHDVYLLDEPTFGQDAKTMQAIIDQLAGRHQDGKTIIMTTHDMDLVMRYATRVVVLSEHHILYDGDQAGLFERPDLMKKAHLRADEQVDTAFLVTRQDHEVRKPSNRIKKTPLQRLHPSALFLTFLVATTMAMFASQLPQAIGLFIASLAVIFGIGQVSVFAFLKRFWPFFLLYILYFFTNIANIAPPPGAHVTHFLWYTLSVYGLIKGMTLSIRMLGSVLFGILLIDAVDFTDLVIGFCTDFFVPPQFAYGTMAGLRVVPLFSSEWKKLRQARQIRGVEKTSSFLRVITYALPILSQGIRMSERVAIAMEARGFVGVVTQSAKARTFYRRLKIHFDDYLFFVFLLFISFLCLSWL